MKNSLYKVIKNVLVPVAVLALASTFVVACSDSEVAGGTTEDAGIIADLNVAGVTQKGPFVKGSHVTVQGVDCKTLKFTDETFEGSVKNDKGEFVVDNVTLSSTCAVFEVSGYYLNELTGKKSSEKLTLHALTNLKDRKNVNINVLTELEYERVMYLVTEKGETFAEAKKQAEKEVLVAFSVKVKDGEFALSEDLNILESGDDNAALLAVSVMMQSDLKVAKLVERVNDVATDIAKDGLWDDDKTKTEIAEWAATADKNGELANVNKNIEKWGGSGEVSTFETVVEKFADSNKGTSSSSITSAGSVTLNSSSSKNVLSSSSSSVIASEAKQSSSSRHSGLDPESSSSSVIPASSGNRPSSSSSTEGRGTSSIAKDSYLNPNIVYGEMTDSRDGQVYKTVKIGDQIWMAQNLNYTYLQSTENMKSTNFCYDNDPENCAKYGRLYTWTAAMESCPSDWHLPSKDEWNALFMAVGGEVTAGKILKSQTGWNNNGNGTDAFGFSALPAGERDDSEYFRYDGDYAYFWSATKYDSRNAYCVRLYHDLELAKLFNLENSFVFSIRCLKDYDSVASSSGSSAASSSSVEVLPPCKTETEDNCEYGTLTDDRDGQTYKTVKIGDQVWMAQNLNYVYLQSTDDLDSVSFCYNDSLKYCDKYGRLYTWSVAIDSVGAWGVNGKGCGYGLTCSPTGTIRGVCPEGWHLPTDEEWNTLFTAVGGLSTASTNLKSTSGWYEDGNGTDAFGFSALPAGMGEINGDYSLESGLAYFWSSTEKNSSSAYCTSLRYSKVRYSDTDAILDYGGKGGLLSVRCLKD